MKATNRNLGLLGSVGLGAILMYIFDPGIGKRRRALIRDKMFRLAHRTADAIDATSHDLQNRILGLVAETRGLTAKKEVGEDVLAQRVRSRLGFLVSHPSSVEVRVENGKVILSGPILGNEVDRLLRRISSVRGVRTVENRLEVHESAESIPGLQGETKSSKGEAPDFMQSSWSPATRFMVGTAAGASLFCAARRRDKLGAAVAILSTVMLARALANMEFRRLVGVGAGRRAIDIQKIISVAAPAEHVFSFWTNYENFPRFMSNVRNVRQISESRSHWVVAGPAGLDIKWDAVLTSYVPNETLAWETVPGSPIQHAGIVRFQPNPDGTTRLDVRMSYNPVMGGLGHAVAALFGADPKSQLDQDLMRMKSMIETGIAAHDAARKEKGEAYIH